MSKFARVQGEKKRRMKKKRRKEGKRKEWNGSYTSKHTHWAHACKQSSLRVTQLVGGPSSLRCFFSHRLGGMSNSYSFWGGLQPRLQPRRGLWLRKASPAAVCLMTGLTSS